MLHSRNAHLQKLYVYLSVMHVAIVLVVEIGDDVIDCVHQETVVICNHQSTADVPLLMRVISDHNKRQLARRVCWIMDDIFRFLPFGWISLIHGDFFIKQVCIAKNSATKQ